MKKIFLLIIPVAMITYSCTPKKSADTNPFFVEWDTPFGVPPFDKIDNEHYIPAYQEAMKQHKAEIDAIVNNSEAPTFENTILAYDKAGEMYSKVSGVFNSLSSANSNDRMREIENEITPKITAHFSEISLNLDLFKRVKAIFEQRNDLNLNAEQLRLVEVIYRNFQRNGADLPEEKRAEFKAIRERMAMISLNLDQNLLKENAGFKLIIENQDDLAGLPQDVISSAAELAKSENLEGKWVFNLSKPSWIPFLQFSERRDLREKLFTAYFMRGDNNNEYDNKKLFIELITLRQKMVEMLGFKNYAEYATAINMAKNPENVYDFLMKVWAPALDRAKQERDDMQAIIDSEGGKFKLESWDWWYYSEKVRKAKFDLNEEEIKPYFALDNVINGIFFMANKLYGLTFNKRNDIPVYHSEVQAYEVLDKDGSHLSVLYYDPHPRQGSKQGGAWCGTFRDGSYKDGEKITPVTYMVTNFTRPTGDKPALLSWDEAETLFHEFGHALHNFFADGHYNTTSRRVPRDFVELPSQIMENWASEPEVLKNYAKHYETGEPIPDELITKLQNAGHFNQGFATVEYSAAAILDMDWHSKEVTSETDVNEFEKASMDRIGLINEIVPRYRTTNFAHIFNGGYASGYYVYQWAGVLDADAFEAFKESGDLYNQELAAKFRKYILSENGMGEGMEQYLKFRGKEPSIDALLRQKGLK